MIIDQQLFDNLFKLAKENSRRRMNYDLRTSFEDGSQRMLNALLPDTEVPIHRHPLSNENVILLQGKLDEVFYDENGKEIKRISLSTSSDSFSIFVINPNPKNSISTRKSTKSSLSHGIVMAGFV